MFCSKINIPRILGFVLLLSGVSKHLGIFAQRLPVLPWGSTIRFQHERGRYFEGDIMLKKWPPNEQDLLKAGSISARWRGGVIPYVVHNSIGVPGRQAIFSAMHDIQSKTCVRFKPRRNEKDFVSITNFNQGCFSYVGRAVGKQQLNLGPGCWHKTTIIHELVHAVGFWHEQSRLDRDRFINVQWNNIPKYLWREFQKYTRLNNFGTEYDFRSVMHYSYNAFAKDRRRPTITTKQPYPLRLLGTGDDLGGLTEIDAMQINRMYNCTIDDKIKYRKNKI